MVEPCDDTADLLAKRCDECGGLMQSTPSRTDPTLCERCEARATELFKVRQRGQIRNEHRGSRRVHVVTLPDCMKK
jgi:hypothetical protein